MPFSAWPDFCSVLQFAGSMCQVGTAIIAAGIGVMTFRYTKRQSALSLVNQNNALANLVNTTVINSEQARGVLGDLHDCIVGSPDVAVLFMYLNYVHNTYRMRRIGALSEQVWRDTLSSCVQLIGRLRRDQVERLLSRGYERTFQLAVLAQFDAIVPTVRVPPLTTLRPRRKEMEIVPKVATR